MQEKLETGRLLRQGRLSEKSVLNQDRKEGKNSRFQNHVRVGKAQIWKLRTYNCLTK